MRILRHVKDNGGGALGNVTMTGLHGAIAKEISACDDGSPTALHSNDAMMNFSPVVLMVWILYLVAYSWWWLRSPLPMYKPPSPTGLGMVLPRANDGPEVTEEVPSKRKLLWMLRRIMGRLNRAQRAGNRGKQLRLFQSKKRAAYVGSTDPERTRISQILEETDDELTEDDEFPSQRYDGDMTHNAVLNSYHDFKCYMTLLEHTTFS
eukprot:s929_g2.t1